VYVKTVYLWHMHVVQRVHDTDQTAVAIYFVNLYLYKTKKIYCGSD